MKNSRFKFEYRANASKLHIKVGELLRDNEIFCNNDIYQEYPVDKINTNYPAGTHHFDWVIPKLNLVFECHGQQHYEPVSWTSNTDEVISNFTDLKYRDKTKKKAAHEAGFIYVEIPYHEEKKLEIGKLLSLIEEGKKELKIFQEEQEANFKAEEELHLKMAEKTKALEEIEKLEKEKQRQKHLKFLKSKEHRDALAKARDFRRQRYLRIKEKRNG